MIFGKFLSHLVMNCYESWYIVKSGRFPIVCSSWIFCPVKGNGVFDTDAMFCVRSAISLCAISMSQKFTRE